MKKVTHLSLIIFFGIILLNSCGSKEITKTSKMTKQVELQDLIGKTYALNYSSMVYHITIKSDSTLHWKLIKGDFPSATEGTENFIHSKLYDSVHYISWTELSGLGLYNVLDFKSQSLTTHGNHDGHMFVNPGSFEQVEE